jgi:excisionase family DNA binding protein
MSETATATVIDFEAACARVAVSERTMHRYIKAGYLPAYELPTGKLRFKLADVDGLLTRKTVSK